MEIFKQLSKKGYKHYYEGTVEELDSMDKNNPDLHSEIMQVIMWLYEKHGIWIEVRHIKTFNVNRFYVIVWNYKDTSDYMTIHCENGVGYEVWDSPTEAYESAIEYTLKNLIQ